MILFVSLFLANTAIGMDKTNSRRFIETNATVASCSSGLEHGIQALFKDTLRREELWLCNDQYMVNINIACVSVFKRTPTYLSKEQNPRDYDLEIIALCVRK